jgi:hypothetical protein
MTPKTASKAAVFCRLPTGTQLLLARPASVFPEKMAAVYKYVMFSADEERNADAEREMGADVNLFITSQNHHISCLRALFPRIELGRRK